RFVRCWSSDVCSSDLMSRKLSPKMGLMTRTRNRFGMPLVFLAEFSRLRDRLVFRDAGRPLLQHLPLAMEVVFGDSQGALEETGEIGRASCRERGERCD